MFAQSWDTPVPDYASLHPGYGRALISNNREDSMIAKATNGHVRTALPLLAAALTACLSSPALSQQKGVTPFSLSQAERAKVVAALPNWSGLWNPVGGLIFDPSTADPKGNSAQQPGDREHPPYNAEWEAKYKAKLDHTLAGYFTDPITNCLPHGMPRLMGCCALLPLGSAVLGSKIS